MNQIVFKDRHKDFLGGRTAESILGESVPGFCFPNVIFLERICLRRCCVLRCYASFLSQFHFQNQPYPTYKIKRFACPHLMYLAQSPQRDHSKHSARLTLFWSRQHAPKAGLVFFFPGLSTCCEE